jgi:hypothetical protein
LRWRVLPRGAHGCGTKRQAARALWRGRCGLFLHGEVFRSLVTMFGDMDHSVEQGNKQKPNALGPYLARQMSERKSLAGWQSAPALNPKMRRGLSVLLVS